jgi:hypothetical protein
LNAGISLLAMQPAGKNLRNAYVICVILGDVLTSVFTVRF